MLYDFAILVKAGTKKDSPKEQELNLTHGIIHWISVEFPGGCKGYVYLVICHRQQQKWPTNIDEAFNANAYTIPLREHYDLTEPPHTLLVKAWSPDATYDHTITVRVGILPEKVLLPVTGLTASLKRLFTLIGVRG